MDKTLVNGTVTFLRTLNQATLMDEAITYGVFSIGPEEIVALTADPAALERAIFKSLLQNLAGTPQQYNAAAAVVRKAAEATPSVSATQTEWILNDEWMGFRREVGLEPALATPPPVSALQPSLELTQRTQRFLESLDRSIFFTAFDQSKYGQRVFLSAGSDPMQVYSRTLLGDLAGTRQQYGEAMGFLRGVAGDSPLLEGVLTAWQSFRQDSSAVLPASAESRPTSPVAAPAVSVPRPPALAPRSDFEALADLDALYARQADSSPAYATAGRMFINLRNPNHRFAEGDLFLFLRDQCHRSPLSIHQALTTLFASHERYYLNYNSGSLDLGAESYFWHLAQIISQGVRSRNPDPEGAKFRRLLAYLTGATDSPQEITVLDRFETDSQIRSLVQKNLKTELTQAQLQTVVHLANIFSCLGQWNEQQIDSTLWDLASRHGWSTLLNLDLGRLSGEVEFGSSALDLQGVKLEIARMVQRP